MQFDNSQNKNYEEAINRAINNPKTKVKEKHLRLVIMGTCLEKGTETFWRVALGFPYLNSKPVAWKLCYVLHRVLREGHSLCCGESHKTYLDRIGGAWYRSDEDFAEIIPLYTKLLTAKLEFHFYCPDFPGHLDVTLTELQLITKNDMHNYFQLLFHIFGYWDRILNFQEAVLKSLLHTNSRRKAWKCVLDPLVLSIYESSQLYNHSVIIIFILGFSILAAPQFGVIRRFREQFLRLKSVYSNANIVQCRNIHIPVPPLPEKTLNLLMELQYGLGSSRSNCIDLVDKMATSSSGNELTEQIMPPEENGFVEQNLIVLSNYSLRSYHNNSCCIL